MAGKRKKKGSKKKKSQNKTRGSQPPSQQSRKTLPNAPSSEPPKVSKPPTINIKRPTDFNSSEFVKALKGFYDEIKFYITLLKDMFSLQALDLKSYRKVITFLKRKNMEYYTYQFKKNKAFRVVLRNLDPSTVIKEETIQEEIEALGFKVRSISKVIHPYSKITLPLFFISIEPASNNEEIFDLKILAEIPVKVMRRKKEHPPQCHRCQAFGHTYKFCHNKSACVKCAGPHLTIDCTKPNEEPPKCVLCSGDHPANYRGCPIYKEFLMKIKHPKRKKSI